MSFAPSGCSTKTVRHFFQCYREGGTFRPIDQEPDPKGTNDILDPDFYDPDRHPLSRVHVPVRLWYADSDWSGSRINMQRMIHHLPALQV